MKKILLAILSIYLFSGCINKHGISAKYYSDCKEYYDLQGYYHKECVEDDVVTYKEIKKVTKNATNYITGKKKKPKGNVW
jgi:hypothetical protein